MFVMGLGEELWKRFLPRYLQQLGAPVVAIGTFGTAMDFPDGVYQYPGGWLQNHRRILDKTVNTNLDASRAQPNHHPRRRGT